MRIASMESTENRQLRTNYLRRCFITIAVASGVTRDLNLTWDGGHDTPRTMVDPHIAEFHASGRVVRESITEDAIAACWKSDEGLRIVQRAVEELLKY